MKTITAFLVLIAVLCACSSRQERNCRKADRHIGKAAALCPERIKPTEVVVPATEGVGERGLTQAEVDCMLERCAELRAVVHEVVHDTVHLALPIQDRQRQQKAVLRIQAAACGFDTIETDDESLWMRIWWDRDALKVRWVYLVKERPCDCPPQAVRNGACPGMVGSGWRSAFIVLALCAAVVIAVIVFLEASRRRDEQRSKP